MKTRLHLISIVAFLSLQTAQAGEMCLTLFANDRAEGRSSILAASQPRFYQLGKTSLLFHNSEIGAWAQTVQGLPRSTEMIRIHQKLNQNLAFEFPLTEQGFLPAANNGGHAGGYGAFMWLRDLARARGGVAALPELFHKEQNKFQETKARAELKKMDQALFRIFTEPDQVIRTLQNVFDPEFHKDAANGYRNVPFVRLNVKPRELKQPLTADEINLEAAWGHKQNDALALYAHALLDGIAQGEIKPQDISLQSNAELIYLVSYFQRLQFYHMKDVGAWEETMGVRTSSVGLVSSFLERFNNGFNQKIASTQNNQMREQAFFKNLRSLWQNGQIKSELLHFVQDHSSDLQNQLKNQNPWDILAHSISEIENSNAEAQKFLLSRLGISVDPHTGAKKYSGHVFEVLGEDQNREGDAALFHLLLHPPQYLTLADRIYLTDVLKKQLMRDSGFARYRDDWFHHGGAMQVEFAAQLPIDPETMIPVWHHDNNDYVTSTREYRDWLFKEFYLQKYKKDMSAVVAATGKDLEMQWSFQDPMLVQIYVQFYKETHDMQYLKMAWTHMARSLAGVTGENQLSIEGHAIEAWRAPEGWVPTRLIQNGKIETAYFASPNSPLNWTTAELAVALNQFTEALKEIDMHDRD